ncbi:unnamed protein product [Durusdinium trenchii]|uniref:Uncharacterized protein n=1 Tax=Durusdinium trenchii TaxID=1381693 RepID=A0ABP0Q634_9DINO
MKEGQDSQGQGVMFATSEKSAKSQSSGSNASTGIAEKSQALANVAYDHEEALDAFLLGIEKDPVRFEKMIGCYRAMAEVQFERQQRKELLGASKVRQCSAYRVRL